MKTAKEWLREWFDRDVDIPPLTGFIQDIQSDALLHAAKICRDLVSTSGSIRVECAKAIEAEANKLKP